MCAHYTKYNREESPALRVGLIRVSLESLRDRPFGKWRANGGPAVVYSFGADANLDPGAGRDAETVDPCTALADETGYLNSSKHTLEIIR